MSARLPTVEHMARSHDKRRVLEAQLAGSRRRLVDLHARKACVEEIEDVEAHIAALEARLGSRAADQVEGLDSR